MNIHYAHREHDENTKSNQNLNIFNIWLMWFSPKHLYGIVANRPHIILPMVYIIMATVTLNIMTANKTDWEATFLSDQNLMESSLTDKQYKYMLNQAEQFKYLNPAINIVLIPFGIFLLTGCFFLILKIYGSTVDFNQLMSTVLLALLPPILSFSVLKMVLLFGQPLMSVDELNSLVRSSVVDWFSMELNKYSILLLKSIDIFLIWTAWLLITGITIVAKVKDSIALMTVITCGGIYLLVQALFLISH
jgi:hypothetical protein